MGNSFSADVFKVKLKSMIERVNLQRNKKANVTRATRREIAALLEAGKDETARIKAEQYLKDENLSMAMEVISLMASLVLSRLPLLASAQRCPEDLIEPCASFIYFGRRVSEISECQDVAVQLSSKFTEDWVRSHADNKSGRVSPRIVKLLDISAPPFETIIKTLHNIAGEMGVEWEPKMVNEDNKDDIQAMGSVAVLAPGGAVVAPRSNVRGDDVEELRSKDVNAVAGGVAGGAAAAGGAGDDMASLYPGTLNIKVHRCKDLFNAAWIGTQSPYVKINIAGDPGGARQTHPDTKGGTDPTWDKEFMPFKIMSGDQNVYIRVYTASSVLSDTLLGTTVIDAHFLVTHPEKQWYGIAKGGLYREGDGAVEISTQFMPFHASNKPYTPASAPASASASASEAGPEAVAGSEIPPSAPGFSSVTASSPGIAPVAGGYPGPGPYTSASQLPYPTGPFSYPSPSPAPAPYMPPSPHQPSYQHPGYGPQQYPPYAATPSHSHSVPAPGYLAPVSPPGYTPSPAHQQQQQQQHQQQYQQQQVGFDQAPEPNYAADGVAPPVSSSYAASPRSSNSASASTSSSSSSSSSPSSSSSTSSSSSSSSALAPSPDSSSRAAPSLPAPAPAPRVSNKSQQPAASDDEALEGPSDQSASTPAVSSRPVTSKASGTGLSGPGSLGAGPEPSPPAASRGQTSDVVGPPANDDDDEEDIRMGLMTLDMPEPPKKGKGPGEGSNQGGGGDAVIAGGASVQSEEDRLQARLAALGRRTYE